MASGYFLRGWLGKQILIKESSQKRKRGHTMDTFFLTFMCNTGPNVLYDGLHNFYDIRRINIKYIANKQKS